MGEAELFVRSKDERHRFNGLVEMHGTNEKPYSVELLMAEGLVTAMEITIEGEETIYGDAALRQIKNLGGSEGDLRLIRLRAEDMKQIIANNTHAMLGTKVLLENFKLRVRPLSLTSEAAREDGGSMLDAVKSLLSVGGPSMKNEFRGQFKIETPRTETLLPKESDAKKAMIEQIKRRRMGRFVEKISVKQEQEKQQQDLAEGKMVETTIDKLFNLVDKRNKVKINDALAKEIGVSKERIEEWAVIMEEHNLVSVNYPTIGEPEITRKHKND